MKKKSKVVIGALAAIAVVAVAYRVVNQAPAADLTATEKLTQILDDGGCMSCHSENPKLPFYANMPIASSLITKDIVNGYKAYDIAPFMKSLADGTKPSEVDLAKVEKTIADGTMPIHPYPFMHWGSSITSTKREMSLAAIKEIRSKFYPNPHACEEFKNETARPIPDSIAVDNKKVALGEKLYFDTRLSVDNTVSCSTCHGLETGGVDNKSHSEGIKGLLGGVNAPTVFNAYFNFVQFWDGRAANLAERAAGPPLNPVEMGCASFDEIVGKLNSDAAIKQMFAEIYPEGVSQATITDAIQEFEKTLITPNSAFDLYLKGDKKAMNEEQIKGFELFKEYNCAMCHVGEYMGGQHYDLMGCKGDYFGERHGKLTDGDKGRNAQTKCDRDNFRFKTPGLRNVELTAPYYHDGSVATLEEAVSKMAKYQVGITLTKEEETQLTSFMKALTGTYIGKKLTNTNMK